jgi:hypothetical protein
MIMELSELETGCRYLIEYSDDLQEWNILEKTEGAVKVEYMSGYIIWLKEKNLKYHYLFSKLPNSKNQKV